MCPRSSTGPRAARDGGGDGHHTMHVEVAEQRCGTDRRAVAGCRPVASHMLRRMDVYAKIFPVHATPVLHSVSFCVYACSAFAAAWGCHEIQTPVDLHWKMRPRRVRAHTRNIYIHTSERLHVSRALARACASALFLSTARSLSQSNYIYQSGTARAGICTELAQRFGVTSTTIR